MGDIFSVLMTRPPEIKEAAAKRFLRDHYGIEGTLKVLFSERDQNFLVEHDDGQSSVLKIANSAEAPAVTEFQNLALLHVAKTDAEFPAPRVVQTLSASTSTTISDEDGRKYTARLLTWLQGIPLGDVEPQPNVAEKLGALLARLGIALRDFDHPASDYDLLWDIKSAENLGGLLECIEDDELRAICTEHLREFSANTKPALIGLRSQVIYNDLHSDNVLVDPDEPEKLTGVIDFGDMLKSPLIIDVAVACAYLLDAGTSPLAGILNFLRGYTRVRVLQPDEIDLLYDLTMTRNVMTTIIANWRAARYPENRQYILQGESHARTTIETLSDLGRSQVTLAFREACAQ